MKANLVSILSAGTNNFILSVAKQNSWIGGYQPAGASEPSGQWTWVDQSQWSWQNWNTGEPNDAGNNEDCAEFNPGYNGKWNDRPCSQKWPSVCEIRLGCPPGWVSHKTSCYYYNSASLSWTDAQAACQDMKANLVSILSAGTNNFILSVAKQNSWIGGYQPAGASEPSGQWTWVDQSQWSWQNWNTGEPNDARNNEDCAEFYPHHNGKWNDGNCDARLPSVCQRSISWSGQCVVDSVPRLLELHAHHQMTPSQISQMTPRLCRSTCASKGYSYAGVQFSNQCFCGNSSPPSSSLAHDSDCNMKCSGDDRQVCGGSWRMNVYDTNM